MESTPNQIHDQRLADAWAELQAHAVSGNPLKPMRPPVDEDFHDLIAERYEQVATIVTSNLDFSEWDQAFPANRLLAAATLDRLRHNAYCLTLDGDSYRSPKQAPATRKSVHEKQVKSANS